MQKLNIKIIIYLIYLFFYLYKFRYFVENNVVKILKFILYSKVKEENHNF